jgi:hypothetical protein
MNYFAGLDVSVKNTSVCIVDEMGKIVREVKVAAWRHCANSLMISRRSHSGSLQQSSSNNFGELIATRVAEIKDAAKIEDLRLPWFLETTSFLPPDGAG